MNEKQLSDNSQKSASHGRQPTNQGSEIQQIAAMPVSDDDLADGAREVNKFGLSNT